MTPILVFTLSIFVYIIFLSNNLACAFPRAHGGAYTDVYQSAHFTRDSAGQPQCRQPTS